MEETVMKESTMDIPLETQSENPPFPHDTQNQQPPHNGSTSQPKPSEAVETTIPEPAETTVSEPTETRKRKAVVVEEINTRLTSEVWLHFKKQKIDGVDKAICNYCGKKLSGKSKNGTRHLHDHHRICKPRQNQDIRQAILSPRQEKKDGPVSLGAHTFDQKVSRDKLAKMIILHEYPLNIVEQVGFRDFVTSVNPLFKHVSRPTIRSDIKNIFASERTKMKKALSANLGKVAVTTDMWTATNQKRGYMVVTAHYIDDSWKLCNKILRFMYVPAPHNAKTLSKELMGCLVAWSIDCKLSTLTLDNCSVNISMMDKMKEKLRPDNLLLKGELVHMKCCAHILNLIVQQGLGAIQSGVESIRESVVYWTATPKRVQSFEEAKDGLTLTSTRKLVLDCKTRWNSTYLMLISAIGYKDVFNRLVHTDKNYKQSPTDQDWHLAKVMCEKLKLFYSVTEIFSGVKYPTANIFFPKICEIRMLLNECLVSPYKEINMMATSMIGKFDQYWSLIHGVLAIATILDPRFKMKLIDYYFPQIYGDESPREVERIRKLVYDLVNEYKPHDGKETHSSMNNSDFGMDVNDFGDSLAGYDLFVSSTSSFDTYKSELDYYLEENVLPRTADFDILVWWKASGSKYPTLQQVARDVLAISVSTVASESAFSTGGRHVTPHRNRLHPDMLEALICSQDWLWDEKLGTHSIREKHLAKFEVVKDEDEAGPSYVDFDT